MNAEMMQKLFARFPAGCMQNLTDTEALFDMDDFASDDALSLGLIIVEAARKYGEDIALSIVRESDGVTVFQYVGEHAQARNLRFADMKRQTVLATGHCSLWALAAAAEGVAIPGVFEEGSACLPGGGAFPIRVRGTHVYTVALSGLHNGNDHPLIIESLSQLSGKMPVDFPGMPV